MTRQKVFSPAAAAAATAALLLLLLATTVSADMPLESLPSDAGVEAGSSGSASLPGKLGKLKAKVGGSRFLSAGDSVSTTRGDIRIRGFETRMRFNNLTLGNTRASGLKAQRKVQIPFTRGLAEASNQAAAAAVSRSAPRGDQAPLNGCNMTREERRQRVLQIFRSLLPQIKRRVLLVRLRQRGVRAAQAQQAPSGETLVSSAAEGYQKRIERMERLKQANKQLRKVNRVLLLAVRGLIRKAVELRKELQQAKQQQQQDGVGDLETGEASSSGETPEQLKTRRIVLRRQYPPSVSPLN
ncbi:hypothetical protein Emag_001721 [Eimeria magna]